MWKDLSEMTTRELVLEMLAALRRHGEEPKLLLVHPDAVGDLPSQEEMGNLELQVDDRVFEGCIAVIKQRLDTDAEFKEINDMLARRRRMTERAHLRSSDCVPANQRLN